MDPLAQTHNWRTHEGERLLRPPKKTQSTLFTVSPKNKKTKKLAKLYIPFFVLGSSLFFELAIYSQKPILNYFLKC